MSAGVSESAQAVSFEVRLKTALKAIRAAGVRVVQNVSEAQQDILTDEAPILWTDGRQGNAYAFRDGLPYYAQDLRKTASRPWVRVPTRAQVKTLYFNHAGPDLTAARTATEAFRAQGLNVDWDGTAHKSVMVLTPFHDMRAGDARL